VVCIFARQEEALIKTISFRRDPDSSWNSSAPMCSTEVDDTMTRSDHHHYPLFILHFLFFLLGRPPIVGARSQGFQDEVLQDLFRRVGTTNQFFVEIGYNAHERDEGTGSNTAALHASGWSGLLLDAEHENPAINLHRAFLTSGNAAVVLASHGVPKDLDYLSIDIDGADIWVARAILRGGFRPRVLTVEYNHQYAASGLAHPDQEFQHDDHGKSSSSSSSSSYSRGPTWSGASCFYGSSASAVLASVRPWGYAPVNITFGLDLVFVATTTTTLASSSPSSTTSRSSSPPPFLSESLLVAMHEGLAAPRYSLNAPMTTAEASRLVDYLVLAAGGSLCSARRAAALAARRLARGSSSDGGGGGCFAQAANITPPACEGEKAAASKDQGNRTWALLQEQQQAENRKQIRGVDDDDDDDDDDDENHLPRRLDITNFLCGRGPSPNPRYNYDGSDDENDDDDDVVVTPVKGGGARQQRRGEEVVPVAAKKWATIVVRLDESRQQLEERVRRFVARHGLQHIGLTVCDEAFPPGVPNKPTCYHPLSSSSAPPSSCRAGAAGSSSSSSEEEEEEEEEAACSSGGTVAEREEECDEACVAGQLAEHIAKRLRVPLGAFLPSGIYNDPNL
jgi:hypothetical protein